MMRVTHRDGAILGIFLVINYIIPKNEMTIIKAVTLTAGSILGGYICDIDEPKSYISRKLYFLLWPFYLIRSLMNILAMLPSPFKRILTYVCKILRHKGITHTPLFWGIGDFIYVLVIKSYIITFIVAKFSNYSVAEQCLQLSTNFWYGFMTGIITHMILDFISEGVMLFFPFSIKKCKLTLVKTGSSLEIIVHIAIILTNLYLFKIYIAA